MRSLERARLVLASPGFRRFGFAAWTGGALAAGYALRSKDEEQSRRQLPTGWRACCDGKQLTPAQAALQPKLREIVGAANVKTEVEQKGSRLGSGIAFAVVRPGTLQECLDCLQACVDADVCILPQGANTGLTGASVPRAPDAGLDRPTVVINMTRLDTIIPIDEGKRMVCLGGAGILSVRQKAATFDCESHSVLGSIFLNPTTAAGVAFGSGGTQLRKGPVYTERLLYARVDENGARYPIQYRIHPTRAI
jgi:D-lactate dehydrogenase (quinone)